MAKKVVIKITVFSVALIIAAVLLNIITQATAIYTSAAEVSASMDVMAGNSSTVGGMAAMLASSGVLNIIGIILRCGIIILGICLAWTSISECIRVAEKTFNEKEGE